MNGTRAPGRKNSSPYSYSQGRFIAYVFDLAVLAAGQDQSGLNKNIMLIIKDSGRKDVL